MNLKNYLLKNITLDNYEMKSNINSFFIKIYVNYQFFLKFQCVMLRRVFIYLHNFNLSWEILKKTTTKRKRFVEILIYRKYKSLYIQYYNRN